MFLKIFFKRHIILSRSKTTPTSINDYPNYYENNKVRVNVNNLISLQVFSNPPIYFRRDHNVT